MKVAKSFYAPLIAGLAIWVGSTALAAPTKTIADLKAAYIGETTASAKYAAYAKKADGEGYREAAGLFRAASAAEKTHAANHKAALRNLGVKDPKAGSFAKTPGSTAANLKDAIKDETYEKDVMYPGMIKDATAEKQSGAVGIMTFALNAEKQHAALYTAAIKTMKRGPSAATYYVCPVCGATFKGTAPVRCPVCATPKERFRAFKSY